MRVLSLRCVGVVLVMLALVGCFHEEAEEEQPAAEIQSTEPAPSTHYVDVYIAKLGEYTCGMTDISLGGPGQIKDLHVFPGDVIVWINTLDEEVELTMGDEGSPFEGTTVTIAPHHRTQTVVTAGGYGNFGFSIKCGTLGEGTGGPKISVGDPP